MINPNNSEFVLCLSVSQLAYPLTEIKHIQRYLLICMIYTHDIQWRHSCDICILVLNNFEFHVYLSVCQLAYFLTEIIQIQGYLQFWKRYVSEIFWRHSEDDSTLVPNNSEILVCLSVFQLAYVLTEIIQMQGYLQFCMRYLSEIFGGIPGMFVHLF